LKQCAKMEWETKGKQRTAKITKWLHTEEKHQKY